MKHLFRELLAKFPKILGPSLYEFQNGSERGRHIPPIDTDIVIETCTNKTRGAVPRTSLLALFLYQNREQLLAIFMEWLMSDGTNVPFDGSMPFTNTTLDKFSIPARYHRDIIRAQAIFRPVTLRKRKHQVFSTTDRLPFVGPQASNSNILKSTIARNHWEIETEGRFISGNPNNPIIVALKTFKGIPNITYMEKATIDFEAERGILEHLKSGLLHYPFVLDWGSITILNDQALPISHSLIFELATFSLADLFKDNDIYISESDLLAGFVGIVEAVVNLHTVFKILHLDIQPNNILAFEEGPGFSNNQNHDKHKFRWKLDNFGLARRYGVKQHTGHRMDWDEYLSQKSIVPATRPAGVYQAPEIQERNTSKAGGGSGIWSFGCIALLVLAFITDGPTGVSKLTSRLTVDFLHNGGSQSLFYVSSDSYPWRNGDVNHYRYEYLDNYNPAVGYIPGTQPQLETAVNPQVIAWSNVLYHSYSHRLEQHLIKRWFEVIFCRVLLIDYNQRIKAFQLRDRLNDIRQQWKVYEESSENSLQQVVASLSPTSRSDQLQRDLANAVIFQESMRSRNPEGAPAQHRQPQLQDVSEPWLEEKLCSAIEANDAITVRIELEKDIQQLVQPCIAHNIYPIHWALQNKAYSALEVLLANSTVDTTDIICRGRTALELASAGSGDIRALRCIQQHKH